MRRASILAAAIVLASIAPASAQQDDTAGCIAVARDSDSGNYAAAGCPWPRPVRIRYVPFASHVFDAMRGKIPVMPRPATGDVAPVVNPAPTAPPEPTSPPAPNQPPSPSAPSNRNKPDRQPKRTPDGFRCHPAYKGCLVPKLPPGQDYNCSDLWDQYGNGQSVVLVDINDDPYRLDLTNGKSNGIGCDGN